MSDTTDIEKKSLEAHVELCAERYRFLEQKLETMDEKIVRLNDMLTDLTDMLSASNRTRNDQVIGWAGAIITVLLTIIGYLAVNFVIK